MKEQSVECPYCHLPAPLVSGLQVYPGLRKLWTKKFYKCTQCGAFVGCHLPADADGKGGRGDGTVPLGTLANARLRTMRQEAHAAFDALWKSGRMRRRSAYRWLAKQLDVPIADCHIGHFSEQQCAQTVAAVLAFERQPVKNEHTHRRPHAR